MIKKINKILLKLKKDNKSLHQIDVSSKYVQTNFNFNYFDGHSGKIKMMYGIQLFLRAIMTN